MTFRGDEGANTWLHRAQQAGLLLYWTDEAVNNLYNDLESPQLIEEDIVKKPIAFNGNVTSYINRNRKDYMPKYKKGESQVFDVDKLVTFKWGFRHIFAGGTVLK